MSTRNQPLGAEARRCVSRTEAARTNPCASAPFPSCVNWQKQNAAQRAWQWSWPFTAKPSRIDNLRASLGAGREGTTALSLLNVARYYGLRGRGVRVEIDDLEVSCSRAAFSTGISVTLWYSSVSADAGVQIIDPAYGRRSVTTSELRRSFTGAVLVLEPGETFEPTAAAAQFGVALPPGGAERVGVVASHLGHFGSPAVLCPRVANTDRSARGSRCAEE